MTVEQIQEAREEQAQREAEEATRQEQEKVQPRTPTWLDQAMQACDLAAGKVNSPRGRIGIDVATLPKAGRKNF